MKKILFFLMCSLAVFAAALLFSRKPDTPPIAAEDSDTRSTQQLSTENDANSRLSPDGKTLAIQDDKKLILQDMATSAQKEILIEELSTASELNGFSLEGWSDDSSQLWGIVLFSESPNFFRVVAPNWQVERYPLPQIPWVRDYKLNPNTGLVAYSTIPLFLDAEEAEKFEASEEHVVLFISNLFSGEKESVAESIAKSFRPQWITDEILEYNDPATESRNRYSLPQIQSQEAFEVPFTFTVPQG